MPTLKEKVATWAQSREGQFVPDGQCFALADQALRQSGAKSASDFGTVTKTAHYIWGTPVNILTVQRGDILQFEEYWAQQSAKVTEVRFPILGGLPETTIDPTFTLVYQYERPHHTAVVLQNLGQGAVLVAEQNVKSMYNDNDIIRMKVFLHRLQLFTSLWAYDTETFQEDGYHVIRYKTWKWEVGYQELKAYRPVPKGEQPTADNEGDSIFGSWG
ncbi:MAG TPA: hypothetical protein DCZ69_17275 [Syntrophobacteraceae bacterium]|jgi:hypothetical protein|nr:hypothetical protein [Syntrophobacteraceae bacterium]